MRPIVPNQIQGLAEFVAQHTSEDGTVTTPDRGVVIESTIQPAERTVSEFPGTLIADGVLHSADEAKAEESLAGLAKFSGAISGIQNLAALTNEETRAATELMAARPVIPEVVFGDLPEPVNYTLLPGSVVKPEGQSDTITMTISTASSVAPSKVVLASIGNLDKIYEKELATRLELALNNEGQQKFIDGLIKIAGLYQTHKTVLFRVSGQPIKRKINFLGVLKTFIETNLATILEYKRWMDHRSRAGCSVSASIPLDEKKAVDSYCHLLENLVSGDDQISTENYKPVKNVQPSKAMRNKLRVDIARDLSKNYSGQAVDFPAEVERALVKVLNGGENTTEGVDSRRFMAKSVASETLHAYLKYSIGQRYSTERSATPEGRNQIEAEVNSIIAGMTAEELADAEAKAHSPKIQNSGISGAFAVDTPKSEA